MIHCLNPQATPFSRHASMRQWPFRPSSPRCSQAVPRSSTTNPFRPAKSSLLERPRPSEPIARPRTAQPSRATATEQLKKPASPAGPARPARVKLAFHSSVLMAAVLETHRLHERMRPWLEAVASDEVDARISWRAAAETWLVLSHRRDHTLADADAVIEALLEHFQPVETTGAIYREALRRCTEKGLGYALVDALHLVAAEETGADGFVTLHGAHFEPLRTPQSPKILPPEPPTRSL